MVPRDKGAVALLSTLVVGVGEANDIVTPVAVAMAALLIMSTAPFCAVTVVDEGIPEPVMDQPIKL